ncbi:MAG: UvrD-helicase domain-containing protein [Vampirovibrionales bacterium]|nr:UvrD-helicase domain-containing protein [Vampirovibrionales bacterium]
MTLDVATIEQEAILQDRPTACYAEGPLGSGKTQWLVEGIATLLGHGVCSDSILVLCSNHTRQQAFADRLLALTPGALGDVPCMTFAGLVRKMLGLFWPRVEARLARLAGSAVITPSLTGFEETEQLLGRLIADHRLRHPVAFADFSGTEQALINQLIRRLRLRAENNLTREQMWERSRLLQEPCLDDVMAVEKALDRASLSLRMLDPARQLEIFHTLVKDDPVIQSYLTSTIRHLAVDDVDETTPSQQAFVSWLSPQAASVRMTVDVQGGSRRGYLNAFPYDWPALKALVPGETVVLERTDAVAQSAGQLLSHWLQTPIESDEHYPVGVFKTGGVYPTRLETWDAALQWVMDWLEAGESSGDLALVLPRHDVLATEYLVNALRQRGIAAQTLAGTQRPLDDALARCYVLTLQQLHARRWASSAFGPLSALDVMTLLTQLLRVDVVAPESVMPLVQAITAYEATVSQRIKAMQGAELDSANLFPLWPTLEEIPATETFRWEKLPPIAVQRYNQYRSALNHWQDKPFARQIYGVFQEAISPFVLTLTPTTAIQTLIKRAESFTQATDRLLGLEGNASRGEQDPVKDWLLAVRQGQMADTPSTPRQENTAAVIIGTPQKLIDVEARRKHMAWLDVASREWARSDNAPLYNAWVHSAYWDYLSENQPENEPLMLTDEHNRQLIRRRAGHLTRTLALLATESISVFTSTRDDQNREQAGDLEACLRDVMAGRSAVAGSSVDSSQALKNYPALRADQLPVLDYQGGTMAIAAVPGAGKTFVNVALILKLIAEGVGGEAIPAESILVLTYMDSAARTLLGRLQRQLGANSALPAVSTIHGLAFRLLTENDRFRRFPELGDELTLMDEFEQQRLLEAVVSKNIPPLFADKPNQWLRLCQRLLGDAKTYRVSPQDWANALARYSSESVTQLFSGLDEKHRPAAWNLLSAMQPVYSAYQQACQQRGLIDFTDLIGYAIRLLEEDADVRHLIQQRYRVILEDEAQDSSHLLQQLIALMGGASDGKRPNLIRTGDTNQSITTSFTAADPSVFRAFLKEADTTVVMDGSARCAPAIMALANQWMRLCGEQGPLANAFDPVDMTPVVPATDGGMKNPDMLLPVEAHRLATSAAERTFLVERLGQLKAQYPNHTLAVLLPTNDDVLTLTQQLQEAGLPAVCLSEQLNTQTVFQVLRHLVHVLAQPTQIHHAHALLEALHLAGRLPTHGLLEDGPTLDAWQQAVTSQTLWFGDDWPHPALMQWVYDVRECQSLTLGGNLAHMLLVATQRWFTTPTERSNGWLCALEVQRFLQSQPTSDPVAQVAAHLDRLHAARRFRQPFGDPLDTLDASVIQVMTLHKSKGQEFDVVLLPSLVSAEFTSGWDERLSYGFHQLLSTGFTRTPAELIHLRQEERARLLYVGISRAKKGLIATTSAQVTNRMGQTRAKQPALVFEMLEASTQPARGEAVSCG